VKRPQRYGYSRSAKTWIRIDEAETAEPLRQKRALFVTIDAKQVARLEGVNPTWDLYLRLLFAAFEAHGEAFELRPVTFGKMARTTRNRALADLEKRGLISVQRQRGKPPLIAVLKG
jgi:hypothetical protein